MRFLTKILGKCNILGHGPGIDTNEFEISNCVDITYRLNKF
jgi:hypothetical protein